MLSYEIEQALSRKADSYRVDALTNDISSLKQENQNLHNELDRAKSRIQNQYSALSRLIEIIIDSELVAETSELFEMKQYL